MGGSALSELTLASQLGSSRTPIREAIGQLLADGLLGQTPTGTVLVTKLRREDLTELYELRKALELYAIGKVATMSLRSDDRSKLQCLVDEIRVLLEELDRSSERALDEHQMERFLASDFAFHSLLISIAGNTRIQKIVNEMRVLIRIFSVRRRGHERELLESIHKQHQGVLNAVHAGDVEQGRNVLAPHIRTSLQERLEELTFSNREIGLGSKMPRHALL